MDKVESILKESLRRKLKAYNPEPAKMPFHTSLLGRDRMALFSFIQSLNTNVGTAIFEPVAEAIAEEHFDEVRRQRKVGNSIGEASQREVQRIMDGLVTGASDPNAKVETQRLERVAKEGETVKTKPSKADLYLRKRRQVYLIDIKTAKPNKSGFEGYKRTLLEWSAIFLRANEGLQVRSMVAIPYNPYEPKPYRRWTMKGMLDLNEELKVAEEFWNVLAGKKVYEDLLLSFERVGQELRHDIDAYFRKHIPKG